MLKPKKNKITTICRSPQCRGERGGLFMRPQVSYSMWEIFNRGNWSKDTPSPQCQCSTEDLRRMLPDCPHGAGGLPPPQVSNVTSEVSHADHGIILVFGYLE